jgi:hypothetical protein
MSSDYTLWNSIQANTLAISENTADILVLQQQQGGIPQLTQQVATNTADITTLNGQVSTNSADIITLQGDVSTNTSDIAANTGAIASSAADITSLQNDVSALQSPPCGQWYKTSNQTVNTVGAPSNVPITWSASTNWTDTSIISHNAANGPNFTVNKNGIYRLDLQVLYNNISSATFTDRTLLLRLNLTRGGHTSQISQTNFDVDNNNPTNVGVSTGLMFELKEEDVISFHTLQYISAGSFVIVAKSSSPPDDFDLNTFWSWQLIRSL